MLPRLNLMLALLLAFGLRYAPEGAYPAHRGSHRRSLGRGHPRPVPPPEPQYQPLGLRRTPGALGVGVHGRGRIEQRPDHSPGGLDHVLTGEVGAVADQRGVQEHLVGGRVLAALLGPSALRKPFPTSLRGRNSHYYSEHSVTLGLAPRGLIPRSSLLYVRA